MKSVTVSIGTRSLEGTVRLPASKSISNRVMLIRALTGEDFPIENRSDADDTILLDSLQKKISGQTKNRVCEMDAANAGTVMRFLTAYLSIRPGRWVLTGSDRMRERPIGVLADALTELGAEIEYLSKPGFPPLLIKGRELNGGEIHIDAGISSQFVSALLMIAPYLKGGLTIRYTNRPVSLPYIEMTARLMTHFGAKVRLGQKSVSVKEGAYVPRPFTVEPDWSSAAFWYEAVALCDKASLFLPGLQQKSLQGDSVLPGIYANLGVGTEFTREGAMLSRIGKPAQGFYFDFTDHPDLAPAVITTCAALGIRGRFEGLNSLRIKETDRITALRSEYERLGIDVESAEVTDMLQSIEIAPGKKLRPVQASGFLFETYGDHRMAMTFAPLALRLGPVKIVNPDVVTKSYPGFWDEMKGIGFDLKW